MRLSGLIFSVTLAVAAVSCGSRQSSSGKAEAVAVSQEVRPFPAVEVPRLYEGEQGAEYYLAHYWDRFADTTKTWRCDSAYVAGVAKGDLEQAFSNFVYAAGTLPIDAACDRMLAFYRQMSALRGHGNAFQGLMEIAERYLYDPNSPVRNEDLWQPLAASIASDPATDANMRMIYDFQSQMCSLNRVGSKAADFRFSDRNGKIRTLHSVKAETTLLFFSNPGCSACKQIIETLRNSMKVDYLLSEGRLAVVNVYIDEDLEAWMEYMPYYPAEWYNGYDPDFVIRTDLTYNVRAIPSLYILSEDKTVIAKDIPEQILFNYIDNL